MGAATELALGPGRALALWSDPERWGEFVEGFERLVELDARWPAPGASLVWESGPEGRGRVTERVVEHVAARRLVTEVTEEPAGSDNPRLTGHQTFELLPVERSESSSRAQLRLDYELVGGRGSPGPITDLLFIRRALRDALRRTLGRFAAETAYEAAR